MKRNFEDLDDVKDQVVKKVKENENSNVPVIWKCKACKYWRNYASKKQCMKCNADKGDARDFEMPDTYKPKPQAVKDKESNQQKKEFQQKILCSDSLIFKLILDQNPDFFKSLKQCLQEKGNPQSLYDRLFEETKRRITDNFSGKDITDILGKLLQKFIPVDEGEKTDNKKKETKRIILEIIAKDSNFFFKLQKV